MRLINPEEYPSDIIIGEDSYKVKFCKKIPKQPSDTVGLCDFAERTIYIKNGMSQKETLRTFIHEVLHAMCDEHNIKISHKSIYKLEIIFVEFLVANF